MNKGQRQFTITDPKTRKKLVVSRDVYHMVVQNQKELQATQEKLKEVSAIITSTYYGGESRNMAVSYQFNEKSQPVISHDAAQPNIELRGNLEGLSEEIQSIIQQAIEEHLHCISQALDERSSDTESRVKSKMNPQQNVA